MPHPPRSFTVLQAAQGAPTLARLAELAQESGERLRAVAPLIPPTLRPSVQPGPLEDAAWCLLVDGSAACAKLRQLLPTLQARLREQGWENITIRLKVRSQRV